VRNAVAVIGVAVLVSAGMGCKGSDEDVTTARATASGAPVAATAAPVDHLAPGELVEGKELAYGVPLPRDSEQIKAIAPSVYGRVHGTTTSLEKYFKARVSGGKLVHEPAGSIIFDQAHGADPKVALYIRIDHDPEVGARFEVRDATPPVAELHANDEERWRANGLKPNGAVDPTTIH
jgi:hypothetical protein